jgi:glycosyltransferase involved in cell wall biosynthesis
MQVAVFSSEYEAGGAGKAAQRLCDGLAAYGRSVVQYAKKSRYEKTGTYLLTQKDHDRELEKALNRFFIHADRSDISNTLFSLTFADSCLPELKDIDIINLHWIEFLLSPNNLEMLVRTGKPIVWTLHDMKPFTGGCHYSAGCSEYLRDCSSCMQLDGNTRSVPEQMLALKKSVLEKANLTIVSPSRWLADAARRSSLFGDRRIEVIPNGIDTECYVPHDKAAAKRHWGIEPSRTVLLFGAQDGREKRKGYAQLLEALRPISEQLKQAGAVVLLFGRSADETLPLPSVAIGTIESDEEMAWAYSAADLFILPSLEDNLPNTLLESLACETPVVAFDTGGVRDIVDVSTGIVVEQGSVSALSDAIVQLVQDGELRKTMGQQGRQKMVQGFTTDHQARRYAALFDKLVKYHGDTGNTSVDCNAVFDPLIGYMVRHSPSGEIALTQWIAKIEEMKRTGLQFAVYGYGTVGECLDRLLPGQIVSFVDMDERKQDNERIFSPECLSSIEYDAVVITVLGREKSILAYLTEELSVPENKIVMFQR